MSAEHPWYRAPGPLTRVPGALASLLIGLPRDIARLCQVVQGVVMHPDLTALYGLEVPPARKDEERELRSLAQMLARIAELDARPLAQARAPELRMLGTCRSFATLLCGLLRFQGIPARARCGFARYFVPGKGEDHWVCEVWSHEQARWILVDAQLDPVQLGAFHVSLDPLDVPRDGFLPGGRAWRECREDRAQWSEFGLSMIHESGPWFVLGDFVRDVAALNKLELLPWDCWGLMGLGEHEDRFSMSPSEVLALLPDDDLSQLDRLAHATSDDVDFDTVRQAHDADERFRVPRVVFSVHARTPARRVDLDSILR